LETFGRFSAPKVIGIGGYFWKLFENVSELWCFLKHSTEALEYFVGHVDVCVCLKIVFVGLTYLVWPAGKNVRSLVNTCRCFPEECLRHE